MGISNTSQATQQLGLEYKQIGCENNGKVLCHIDTNQTYFLREISCILRKDYEQQKDKAEAELHMQHENVIRLVQTWSREYNNFCSNTYKIYKVYEYPQITLLEQISARSKQSRWFDQNDLWSIIQSCTNALLHLKPIITIEPSKVFIMPDGLLKLLHNDMLQEEYRSIVLESIYYAPEKINNFKKPDKQFALQKQAIFSMGMTILNSALLHNLYQCYDYKNCRFVEEKLEAALIRAQQHYSEDLLELLRSILQVNPNRRSSLMEIQEALNQRWTAQQNLSQSIKQPIINEQKIQQAYLVDITNQNYFNSTQENKKQTSIPLQMKYLNNTTLDQKNTYNPYGNFSRNSLSIQNSYTPTYENKQNLFTDPKIFEMIRNDLHQINYLKKSISGYDSNKFFYQPTYNTFYNPNQYFQQKSTSYNFRQSIKPVFVTVRDSSGTTYEGMMVDGKREGKGKLVYPQGAYYQGNFNNDQINGFGILYYSQNHLAYEGNWVLNEFNGHGVLYNKTPQPLEGPFNFQNLNQAQMLGCWLKYDGNFEKDNRNGQGILSLSNGETFEGTFLRNRANGRGKFINVLGEVIQGRWEDNILVDLYNDQL